MKEIIVRETNHYDSQGTIYRSISGKEYHRSEFEFVDPREASSKSLERQKKYNEKNGSYDYSIITLR